MRFLIDECLHTSLTDVANNAGLIVSRPNFTPALQRELFQRALVEASKLPDMGSRHSRISTVPTNYLRRTRKC